MTDRMADWFKDTRTLSAEEVLLDYARRLDRHRAGWQAVEIKVSLLRPHHQRPQHLRIIAKTLEPLVKKYDAGLYPIYNNNMVVLVKGATIADIDACILKIRYLFSEDPLFAVRGGEQDEEHFCTWYDLGTAYPDFLARVEQMNDGRMQVASAAEAAQRHLADQMPHSGGAALDLTNLEALERSIMRADLANVLRRQEICAVIPGDRPAAVFHEIFFSMRYLADTVLPGYDVTSDKWLFQHLSRVLDQRMLALLMQREYRDMLNHASLNLTLATVLGREFLEFDRVTNHKDRGTIAIELPAIEVLSDPGDYLFARDFLKERGYKLMIDAVPHLMLPLIDRKLLGFDLVKIVWTPAFIDHIKGRHASDLRDAVERIGRERIILCRVDHQQAIDVGQELGLSLYQGRLIDTMLQARPATTRRG
jgi:hypothetical protein